MVGFAQIKDAIDTQGEAFDCYMKSQDKRFAELTATNDALQERVEMLEARASTPTKDAKPKIPEAGRGSVLFKDIINGKDVYGFKANESMAAEPLPCSPGDILRSAILNDSSGLPTEMKGALTSGDQSGGGYLANPVLSSIFVDLARSASVCIRSGAITVPIEGETHLARLTADATTTWRQETAAITASQPMFDQIVLRPRSVAAIVPVSIELLEDAPNAGQIITNALTAALGLALDKACLVGVSVAEILGVRNYPGVNSTASFGTPADYTKVSAAIGSILSSNYAGEISGLSWIANPREGAKYDSLATGISSDKTPLPRTPWVSQLQTRYTTSLPITEGAGAESSMILGSFSEMIIGMRTRGVTIEVLPAGTATDAAGTTWNAASQMMRWVRAYLRVDMGLMHPAFFNVMTGVAA